MATFNLVSQIINLDDAIADAKSNYLRLRIECGGKNSGFILNTVLKNKPKFGLTAEYDRLINMDEKFGALKKGFSAVANISLFSSKSWTRQVYKGGSYLTISLETRLIAENTPIKFNVARLARLCAPDQIFNDGQMKGESSEDFAKRLQKDLDNIEDAQNNGGTAGDSGNLLKGFLTVGGTTPPLVRLTISNYFDLDMFVAKSVDWTFSHEQVQTPDGLSPIYADVNMELQQIEIRSAEEIEKAFTQSTIAPDKRTS